MSSPLLRLPAPVRKSLSAAFEAERLGPPYTSLALRRYVGAALAGEVATELEGLAARGMEPRHLAVTLGLLAGEVDATPRIDLVWTGPEERGTASRDTGVVVREMFERAEESVLIAGFAVYQGKRVFKVLADRMAARPDLKVEMFLNIERKYRDRTPADEILKVFADGFRKKQWPGERMPEIYYDPRTLDTDDKRRASLHAKCVIVDDRFCLLTSANFTEAAQERNIEAGVLIEDRAMSQMLRAQFDGLVTAGRLVRVPGLRDRHSHHR